MTRKCCCVDGRSRAAAAERRSLRRVRPHRDGRRWPGHLVLDGWQWRDQLQSLSLNGKRLREFQRSPRRHRHHRHVLYQYRSQQRHHLLLSGGRHQQLRLVRFFSRSPRDDLRHSPTRRNSILKPAHKVGTGGGGIISGVATSTAQHYAGNQSLAVNFNGASSGTASPSVSNVAVVPGSTITFNVWIPSGSQVTTLQPYLQDHNWTWTSSWYRSLTANAWNTITLTVPTNAVSPLQSSRRSIYHQRRLDGHLLH